MTEPENDTACIERCLQGDSEAFAPLVERYQRQVFNMVRHMVGNYSDAAEITQQVFVKAFQNLASFDRDRSFFSWIYRVAINESLNHIKARRQWEPLSDNHVDPADGPAERFEHDQQSRELQSAIRKLDPKYRAVIIMRHFLQLSYAQSAGILGIPESTVKSRLFDARQILRVMLEGTPHAR